MNIYGVRDIHHKKKYMLGSVTNKLTDSLNGSFFRSLGQLLESTERIISTVAGAFLFYKG